MDIIQNLESVIFHLFELAAIQLPFAVEARLIQAIERETTEIGHQQLALIKENLQLAKKLNRPLCQDTGLISFFIKFDAKLVNPAAIQKTVLRVTEKATQSIPLRPNAVSFFTGNTGTNIGRHHPWIYWDPTDDSSLEVTLQLKGGGSSNIAKLSMLDPGEGFQGVKKAVIQAVAEAGAKGCPPYTLGIGLGGTEDLTMILAKKSLLVPPNQRNPQKKLEELELELLRNLNSLKIGVMGLGYGPTMLDVHILEAARHPGSLPVGISFSCWALRYATAHISEQETTYPSHGG
ncbi:MAG: fumarate hydratase [Candidatus Helarchaeota archaeon]|nr:fumarate hydratase [Candidatus Helarchaeota archaeon]